MFINKPHYEMLRGEYLRLQEVVAEQAGTISTQAAVCTELRAQKAKDDLSIDWLRNRVNQLEKQNAVLMQKVAGVSMPVPEIVSTGANKLTLPDFSSMPSFEDVGDVEAARLGIGHDESGHVQYFKHPIAQPSRSE